MFEIITEANYILYAMKNYDNPCCHGFHEFKEDLSHIKYLKRSFRMYMKSQELASFNLRLVINHLTILYNVFYPPALTRILFLKFEEDLWPILKTFLVYMNFLPEKVLGINGIDIITSDVQMDTRLIMELRKF